tara:strand:- start:788 stop:1918 length:1131 start_codon:yes stop_codon:yes gene_type:complete
MAIDWNKLRSMEIAVHGIRRADDKLTFYCDETNNIRKLLLTDDGTNVSEHKNFVLGGIVLQEGQALPEIDSLHSSLRLQATATEIKFRHLAKGDFEAALASPKIARFLAWLTDHKLAIHYSSINTLYWSFVDIVDSILASQRFDAFGRGRDEMKNELYRIACKDKPAFLALIRRHGYPNIQHGKAADFLTDVETFLDLHEPEGSNLPTLLLKELVGKANVLSDLDFLVDNNEDVLIENFSLFFVRPLHLFTNATHVFDREIQIEQILSAGAYKELTQGVSYRFSDSQSDPGIQIADVIVGLLGRYQDFVEEHRLQELLDRKKTWSKEQTDCFRLLRGLIDYSDDMSTAFIHRITALDSKYKDNAFMHGRPPMPHLL